MKTLLLSVNRASDARGVRPRVSFYSSWLPEMGFIPGALVQLLPEPNGLVFNLCDDIIQKQSDLANATREMGGRFVHVGLADDKRFKGPCLVTSGLHLYKCGLSIGDPLMARCGYGVVQVRRLPDDAGTKFIPAGYVLDKHTRKAVPKVRLCGGWLDEIGFAPGSLVTVASEPGCMTFRLRGQSIDNYGKWVKYARDNKMKLIQAWGDEGVSIISVTGSFIDKAGFALGDVFDVSFEYGHIKVRTPDFERLGFEQQEGFHLNGENDFDASVENVSAIHAAP